MGNKYRYEGDYVAHCLGRDWEPGEVKDIGDEEISNRFFVRVDKKPIKSIQEPAPAVNAVVDVKE